MVAWNARHRRAHKFNGRHFIEFSLNDELYCNVEWRVVLFWLITIYMQTNEIYLLYYAGVHSKRKLMSELNLYLHPTSNYSTFYWKSIEHFHHFSTSTIHTRKIVLYPRILFNVFLFLIIFSWKWDAMLWGNRLYEHNTWMVPLDSSSVEFISVAA